MVPRPTTPPNAIATNGIIQQHRESPVKIIPEGGASGASGAGLGDGDGEAAIKLNTDHLTASQQVVVNTLEQSGVVSGLVKGRQTSELRMGKGRHDGALLSLYIPFRKCALTS